MNPLVEEFSTRFTQQAGVVHFSRNARETVDTINRLIKERADGNSCAAEIRIGEDTEERATTTARRVQRNMVEISGEIRTSVQFSELERKPRELGGQIDVGITRADFAIAETGSLVDISFTDEHRLLSSFTRVHIAVLEASNILPKLADFAPILRDLLGGGTGEAEVSNTSVHPSRPKPKPAISFIGGPSRTSDIELKSVLGVHGPHEVHVVVQAVG